MTRVKKTIINQLSIIFDQLEKQYDDNVTFHDVVTYIYKNVPRGESIEDIVTVEALLKYIFENEEEKENELYRAQS